LTNSPAVGRESERRDNDRSATNHRFGTDERPMNTKQRIDPGVQSRSPKVLVREREHDEQQDRGTEHASET